MANKRDDKDYEIEALSKGLAILEALEGANFEPVKIGRIIDRCELPRDVVQRSLVLSAFAVGQCKTIEANGPSVDDLSGSAKRPDTSFKFRAVEFKNTTLFGN
jgi:hypothetical protein